MPASILLTGATGFVGEGVLLECLAHPGVERVLVVGRRASGVSHPKLRELLVPDLRDVSAIEAELDGYDACLYCAGISSSGLSEAEYTVVTVDTPLAFAGVLARRSPRMVFVHLSGAHADSSEKGRAMWARVKGRAENALERLPFSAVYSVRPGIMKPSEGQRQLRGYNRAAPALYPVMRVFFPSLALTMREVGLAMIRCALAGAPKGVLEVPDLRALAAAAG